MRENNMKGGIIALFLMILLAGFISADMMFVNSVNSIYNLGDTINMPVTIKTLTDVSGTLELNLICNGTSVNFYKNGVNLDAGVEKTFDSSLLLINNVIGISRGICKIKADLDGAYILTDSFKISDALILSGELAKTTFNPGEGVEISGKAVKENGANSEGFIQAVIAVDGGSKNITQLDAVTNGAYSMNISLPSDLAAGSYLILLKTFEKDSDGLVTNSGYLSYWISVNQVPANLELILENKEVLPGESVKVKGILHDQTGEEINSTVTITIKNSQAKVLEQKEIETGTVFSYLITSSDSPAEWFVYGISNKLTSEDTFTIGTKEEVSVEITNKTIWVTNIGNVLYNKTILVKVDNNPLNIDVNLNVGESKKYVVSAPDGEYDVSVMTNNGTATSGIMSLTGDAINIKEISWTSVGIGAWIFLIVVLFIVIFVMIKKIYKKPSFGRVNNNKVKEVKKVPTIKDNQIINDGNKAEISLSIKGDKQEASMVCIKIKRLQELKTKNSSIPETLKKIIDLAEEKKAMIYENVDYISLILAPARTRTFKNEVAALDLAEEVGGILSEHNRKFNQKVEFGISLNSGTIVGKMENGKFKFMSMGTLVTVSRKIASLAKSEVLLSENMNNLLRLNARTEKSVREGISVYSIKEIKRENEETKKFIDRFMNRQQQGK